jgi:hypothetical protein
MTACGSFGTIQRRVAKKSRTPMYEDISDSLFEVDPVIRPMGV